MKYLFPTLLIFLGSCGADDSEMVITDANWNQDESSDMNATFAEEEFEEIQLFLETHPDWKMTQTGTGLHYMVYSKSESQDTAKVGDVVTVDFEISLLNGEICYTSEIKGPESFMVEKSDIESGLHEGIQYMCPGDRAKFIIPSHAAHGLVGDTDKIPPLTPVIYDIELIRIEQ